LLQSPQREGVRLFASKKIDEMGHLHLLLDEMGLDEMGLDEMGAPVDHICAAAAVTIEFIGVTPPGGG